MNSLNGPETILIIGAGSKLGRAVIAGLPKGMPRILVYSREGLERSKDGSTASCSVLEYCDLSDSGDIEACLSRIAVIDCKIRYLVICAADMRFLGSTLDLAFYQDELIKQIYVNTIAPAVICSTLFHLIWKQSVASDRPVSIVLASSASALHVYPGSGQSGYAASKAALNVLTRHLANEMLPYYIYVNAIAPDSFPLRITTESVAIAVAKLLNSSLSGKVVELGQRHPIIEG